MELAKLSTFRVGGAAKKLVVASNESEIIEAVENAGEEAILVIGAGSNLLISDQGFDGTVIVIKSTGSSLDQDACSGGTITVSAGENWESFVQRTVAQGFSGLESMSGIPGTVGAVPIQNVGAYGHEVAEFIARVRTYDRSREEIVTFTANQCGFGYRTSLFKEEPNRWVVLDVTFQLKVGELSAPIMYRELANELGVEIGSRVEVAKCRAAVLKLRKSKGMLLDETDPDTWSAGSFFTNPVVSTSVAKSLPEEATRWIVGDNKIKVSAAWLLQNSGMSRGDRLGGAGISSKHVLALCNADNATAQEIIELAKKARKAVKDNFGITLTPEVRLIGLTLD